MLSTIGQQSTARLLSPEMLTQIPLTIVPQGESITITPEFAVRAHLGHDVDDADAHAADLG
jgi:hypothetical protein